MRNIHRNGIALIAMLCGGSAVLAQQFIPIPPVDGDSQVFVRAMSGDGSVVVGTSGEYPNEKAFYWTEATGSIALHLGGGSTAVAYGVSGDGSTIVGYIDDDGVRWINGVPHVLDGTVDYPFVRPFCASADGSVLAGKAYPLQGPFGIAMRWTENGLTNLGELVPDSFPLAAYAISDDGVVIVGVSGDEAYRWTEQTGMIGLGFLPGYEDYSLAQCMSGDGSVIGGQVDKGMDYASAYWTEQTGWVEIPPIISSASVSNAVNGISGDASLMVGINTGSSPFERKLFIWDADNGPRPLQETLEQDYGVDFLGWQLSGLDDPHQNEGDVKGISRDGEAILGMTINPDTETRWGWIVYLGSDCPEDVNADDEVDIDDLFEVLGHWGEGPGTYDVNDDGVVDIDDVFAVLGAWGPC